MFPTFRESQTSLFLGKGRSSSCTAAFGIVIHFAPARLRGFRNPDFASGCQNSPRIVVAIFATSRDYRDRRGILLDSIRVPEKRVWHAKGRIPSSGPDQVG